MGEEQLSELTNRIRVFAHGKNGQNYQSRFATSDIVQEAAIQLLRMSRKDEQSMENINSSLLKRLAVGHSKTLREHHSALKRSVNSENKTCSQELTSDQRSPIEWAIKNEMNVQLVTALGKLEQEEKMVIDRYCIKGRSFNAIAREIGVPPHAVRKTYRNALRKLRSELTAEEINIVESENPNSTAVSNPQKNDSVE